MHSNIYQLSKKPIDKEEWVSSEYFYDNSQDFADYIGDEIKGDDRTECIKNLQHALSDIFDLDGETLVYKGEDNMNKFLDDWAKEINKKAAGITWSTILEFPNLYRLECLTQRTHLDLEYRFFIEDYNSYAGPLSDLVEYAASKMKEGDRLQIGAVIDYHL